MHSHAQRQDCLYHRNLIPGSITAAVTATFGKEWASHLMCEGEGWLWSEIWRDTEHSFQVCLWTLAWLETDHTYNWTTSTHMLSFKGDLEFTTQISARTQTPTRTRFQLRRKLLRQESQCVRAWVFTFEYEVNSGCHWEEWSHPARIGNHETA